MSSHVGFVVEKMTLGRFYPSTPVYPANCYSLKLLHTHLPSEARTKGVRFEESAASIFMRPACTCGNLFQSCVIKVSNGETHFGT